MNRRHFLKQAGAAAAGGLFLGGCDSRDPYAPEKAPVPGTDAFHTWQEKLVSSACGQCPAGCGIRVRVVEGRAVRIDGHPGCPINQGGLGPKGQSGLQLLYHPDRIRSPIRRDGPRGSGLWKPVSWDEAIGEIAGRLKELRARGDSKGLVVLDGEPRGMMPQLWDRFLLVYGSPNHVDHRSATDGGKVLAMAYMHGVPELPAYDWSRTRYVLGFGASLFESWCQSIHLARAATQWRRGMPGQRVKFVQVSPRFSVTAAKADEWVPIEPGTYGALALGLAHVLIRDEAYDKDFVHDHTFGFDDWKDAEGRPHRGFRDLVTKDYPPERAAQVTGVSVRTIERLAREMVDHRPAVSLADGGAAAATNGLGTAMSIHALNALLGNLERPGGMLVQRAAPLAPWPAVEPDAAAKAPRVDGAGTDLPLARGFVQGLPEAILSGKPYPVQALLLYRSNPVFSKPDGRKWVEALQKIPLVVSFSPLPDESTFWADLVLPDHTYLERWEIVEPVPSMGYPVLTLREPAVKPLHDTLASGDALIRLARAIGEPTAAAFPWENYRTACEARLKGLLGAKNASVAATSPGELRKGIELAGGWSQQPYPFEQWDGAFATLSKRFEFYSRTIAKRLAEVPDLEKRLESMGVATRGDDLCLPHWEPPRFGGDPGEYPFLLVAYRGMNHAEGGARHIPFLRELPAAGRHSWSEMAEIHPDDLARLKIKEGGFVWVESPAGRRRMMAAASPGTRPGTVGVVLGNGAWPPARDEQTPGAASLLVNRSDPLAGILALQGTRVRVRKDGA
ncbi:MAG: molybdopterin-dependent oxidoreductase [Planctomycetes bacterium]|nr:molybdopterin-dependent oxidoreductase [Planctomycetota bacterium]